MATRFRDRLAHAFNAFSELETDKYQKQAFGYGEITGTRPGSRRMSFANDKSIVTSIYNRLSIDVAAANIQHVRLDDNKRFLGEIPSGLNECLTLKSNVDQGSRAFMQDVALTLFDKGVIAICPIDTSEDPKKLGSYDINSMRVGTIISWYPRHVTVEVYNDRKGIREQLTFAKDVVAIVENPFYSVMNEPNSTLQRLIRKLNLLDAVDEASGSGKLDLIIQLPYVVKNETKKKQAQERAADIQQQLTDNSYGIAYTDGTEKITQLNRPIENNLMGQIEFLTKMLYGQLGITEELFSGSADEATLLNYHNRTIEPILAAITQAMKSTFLTKTARTQKQSIEYYRDPFKFVPIAAMADVADKFSRNEIYSANEIRQFMGSKPSSDPKADELNNSNMPNQAEVAPPI